MAQLIIQQGADWARGYTCKNGSDVVDLTGATVACQFRTNYDASTPTFTLTTSNGGIQVDAAAGQIVLSIPHTASSAVRFKGDALDGVYDVEVTFADGLVERIDEGTWTLTREATRV